jgi:CHAD domain-containing protein
MLLLGLKSMFLGPKRAVEEIIAAKGEIRNLNILNIAAGTIFHDNLPAK